MVGKKYDKEAIMNIMLSKTSINNNNLGVVSILGMGGVGKRLLISTPLGVIGRKITRRVLWIDIHR